jgi:hypothetical protein
VIARWALAALAGTTSACAGSGLLLHEASPGSDLAGYRTFDVRDPAVGHTDANLGELLRDGLTDKGYVGSETPDIVVSYKVLVGSAKKGGADVGEVAAASGDVDMLNVGADGSGESREKVLLVLIQDAQTFETIWVGWSQAKLAPREVAAASRQALTELLDRIPPRRGAPPPG